MVEINTFLKEQFPYGQVLVDLRTITLDLDIDIIDKIYTTHIENISLIDEIGIVRFKESLISNIKKSFKSLFWELGINIDNEEISEYYISDFVSIVKVYGIIKDLDIAQALISLDILNIVDDDISDLDVFYKFLISINDVNIDFYYNVVYSLRENLLDYFKDRLLKIISHDEMDEVIIETNGILDKEVFINLSLEMNKLNFNVMPDFFISLLHRETELKRLLDNKDTIISSLLKKIKFFHLEKDEDLENKILFNSFTIIFLEYLYDKEQYLYNAALLLIPYDNDKHHIQKSLITVDEIFKSIKLYNFIDSSLQDEN